MTPLEISLIVIAIIFFVSFVLLFVFLFIKMNKKNEASLVNKDNASKEVQESIDRLNKDLSINMV